MRSSLGPVSVVGVVPDSVDIALLHGTILLLTSDYKVIAVSPSGTSEVVAELEQDYYLDGESVALIEVGGRCEEAIVARQGCGNDGNCSQIVRVPLPPL